MVCVQGDMVEYNQCQAMLRNLYDLGIVGKVEEFTAYRILLLLHGRNRSGASQLSSYTSRDNTDMHSRFKSIRRSTNSSAESWFSGAARARCSESYVSRELSQIL